MIGLNYLKSSQIYIFDMSADISILEKYDPIMSRDKFVENPKMVRNIVVAS